MFKEFLFGSLEASNSSSGSLNFLDFKKTLRGLLIMSAGAVLTIFFDGLSKWIMDTDFGAYQILITMLINSGLLELGRRYLSERLQ